jgi:hypothetical protein
VIYHYKNERYEEVSSGCRVLSDIIVLWQHQFQNLTEIFVFDMLMYESYPDKIESLFLSFLEKVWSTLVDLQVSITDSFSAGFP